MPHFGIVTAWMAFALIAPSTLRIAASIAGGPGTQARSSDGENGIGVCGRRHQPHRRPQRLEPAARNQCRHIRGHTTARRRLIHHNQPAGILDTLEDCLLVQGRGRSRIDEIAIDAFLRQHIQRLLGEAHHPPEGDYCSGIALTHEVGFAERNRVRLLGNLAFARVQRLVLEEHDRVIIADGLDHQALGIVRIGRHDDLQPGNRCQQRIDGLRMLRSHVHARTHRGADHHRAGALAAEHVAELRDLVVELVHAHADEVGEHDLGHRPQPGQRRPRRRADDGRLTDGRIDDASGAKARQQALGDTEDSARRLALTRGSPGAARDILTEHNDPRITGHLLVKSLVDGIPHGKLRHRGSASV